MPRYSLRTLLILLATAGVLLAWIPYAREMARYHRRKVVEVAHHIAEVEHSPLEFIQESIDILSRGCTVTNYVRFEIYGHRTLVLRNGNSQRHGSDVIDA